MQYRFRPLHNTSDEHCALSLRGGRADGHSPSDMLNPIPKGMNDIEINPLYPSFSSDSKIFMPGQTKRLLCSYNARCECRDEPSSLCAQGTSLVMSMPGDASPLILHPAIFCDGERITVSLTNTSDLAFIIAKDSFDIASRLGHGIFRRVGVIPYERPIARSLGFPENQGDTRQGAS